MAIDKVKLPDNSVEEVRDSRIPGIDSAPTANSGNLVTSGGVKSALDGYLPLTGGTMSNTNLVTNLNADLLDGKHNGDLYSNGLRDYNNGNNPVRRTAGNIEYTDGGLHYHLATSSMTDSGRPGGDGQIIALAWDTRTHWNSQLYIASSEEDAIQAGSHMKLRHQNGSASSWEDWHSVAMTDSNVASATKLETPRTIWGQSFDGTGDVNGVLSLSYASTYRGTGIEVTSSNSGEASIGFTSTNRTVFGRYSDRGFIWGSVAGEIMTLLDNGNVGVGVSAPSYKLDVAGDIRAEKLIGTATGITETSLEDEEFTYQATPVHDIADGYRIDRIKGRTLAFNQLIKCDATYWPNGNGSATFDGTTITLPIESAGYTERRTSVQPIVAGHVYYSKMTVVQVTGGVRLSESDTAHFINTNTTGTFNSIVTANETASISMVAWGSDGDTAIIKDVMLIDLTLMFGAGNEPSTVAEFEAMFPLPYYGYNEGELINNSAEGIETVGFNLWDEEWENGYYALNDGGRPVSSPDYVRSKDNDPIRVFPSTEYCFTVKNQHSINDHIGNVLFYDKAGNYIGATGLYMPGLSHTFTTPAGAYYMRFYLTDYYGKAYANDICINLSDPSRNGTYEPHWSKVLPLGLDAFKVKDSQGNIITVNGLASAGDVRDEIRGGKYIKRVGRVDLGTLTWEYDSGNTLFYVALSAVVDIKLYSDLSIKDTDISKISRYALSGLPISHNDTTVKDGPDKTAYIQRTSTSGSIWVQIKDTSYTDAASFKAAIAGVMLYYELATPVIYDLVSPVPLSGRIDGNGTMRVISDNIVAPFNGDITYGCNPGQIAADSNALMGYVNSVFDLRYYETSEPSGGMLPNREYQLGTLSGNTTFTLAAGTSGVTNHYFWSFDTGSTAPTITWPSGITSWYGGSAPTINASKHYEVSVLNGVAVVMEV